MMYLALFLSIFMTKHSNSLANAAMTSNFLKGLRKPIAFAASGFLSTSFMLQPSLLQNLPLADNFKIQSANAAVAPLADVGIKEFLVKDGRQFLRLAIPSGSHQSFESTKESQDIKQAQENLELIKLRFEQVGLTNPSIWGSLLKDSGTATNLIKSNRAYLTDSKTEKKELTSIFDEQLTPELDALNEAIRLKDAAPSLLHQEKAADLLSQLRLKQLPQSTLPFQIPEEYNALPRLKGRATVEMIVQSAGKGFRLTDGKTVVPKVTLQLEVDGYHAPLTAGNFVDLVNKKFYDGMSMQKVEQLTVQTGKPGKENGFIDPKTGKERLIPLEIFYKKDTEPVYGITSDDDLRATETMALPFQAYGALGMARDNEQPDSGSSQFFMLKWMQALIAPGRNTLDGFYSCFGYVTKNEDLLSQVTDADKIVSMKVVRGLDNLVVP